MMCKLSIPRQACRAQDRNNLWMQWRRQVVAVLWQVPILAIFSASVAMGVTLPDFEDSPAGTRVKTQYGPRGVATAAVVTAISSPTKSV